MMKALMYKEFRLAWSPWLGLYLLFPLWLLFPFFPSFLPAVMLFMAVGSLSGVDKTNQDLAFTSLLPAPRAGVVLVRTLNIVTLQGVMLIVSGLIAVVGYGLKPSGTLVGMNANLACFGLIFIMLAVFNVIFLPGWYKRAYRLGPPLLGASVVSLVFASVVSTLMWRVPWLAERFNDRGLGHLGYQALLLAVGVVIYCAGTLGAYRKAVANFDKVDL